MFQHFTSPKAESYSTSTSRGRSTRSGKSLLLSVLPHIKYYTLIKHVAVLVYMLRVIHTNLTLDVLCYNSDESEDGGVTKVKICLRPSCVWLHWIVLRLPRWLKLPEMMCTGLLFAVLLSSVLMLLSLYIRELEHAMMLRSPHLFKIIITMPSVLIELIFAVLMCYSAVAGAYHWNRFSVPKWSMVLAIIYTFLVIGLVIFQLAFHLVAVAYLCRRKLLRKPVDLQVDCRFDTLSVDSPTSAMLAMLQYQTERTAVTTDLSSARLVRSADSLTKKRSIPQLDLSSFNNNRPMSKQFEPSPSKKNLPESPPYARLRTPTAFQFTNHSNCGANTSPISQPVIVGRLPASSINEEYSIPEVRYNNG